MTASLLETQGLCAFYGATQVLFGLDLKVAVGGVTTLLGANGAGKTTTLRAVCGAVRTAGDIRLAGQPIAGRAIEDIVRRGVAHVPQGRGTFPELTVIENLSIGAFTRSDKEVASDIDRWLTVFPRLAERREQQAGSLSGGEQQMLAVARALMSRPQLLLLDEPSLGLAPIVIADLFERFAELNRIEGTTMLIVEQNANLALDIAHRGYVLEAGEIVLAGTAAELNSNDAVRRAYLGV
jgi:branched-chain amino acid transport system ATP-binding protein